MKQIKKLVFFLFLAISVFSHNVIAATSPLWGNLKLGPYMDDMRMIQLQYDLDV